MSHPQHYNRHISCDCGRPRRRTEAELAAEEAHLKAFFAEYDQLQAQKRGELIVDQDPGDEHVD